MTLLRFPNGQGMAGIGVAFALLVMLTVQKLEAVRWKKQSESFEQLYLREQAAFATTVANARAAAGAARAADQANAARAAAEQRGITERISNDYEDRLAAARAAAERLRLRSRPAPNPGARRNAPLPGVSAASGGPAQAAREGGLSPDDALIATEQAIQLDELIKWVRAQAKVDNNHAGVASLRDD